MTAEPLPDVSGLLEQLQQRRGRPAVFFHSPLTDDTVPILYGCLKRAGRRAGLDLVLSTVGGSITSTRQIAMLVREFTDSLSILVPYRARSAGTLLCLSADELVLGPLAELGPIDSIMGSQGAPAPDTPGTISAEDIRAFRSMAEDWFGIERAEDRLQVLALLAARIFPTSLSSFYRFDKLVREVAAELLEFWLAGAGHEADRNRIVDRLVSGYHSHDVVLTRRDVRALGLPAVDADPAEEELLWSLSQLVHRGGEQSGMPPAEQLVGLIAATGFTARHVVRRSFEQGSDAQHRPGQPDRPGVSVEWEVSG
jgi:Serine dehydrogenase proteinase